jgi:hypothetical protein
MAFKNLEQRFNDNVDKLYRGATSKFEGGKASNGKADAPLITRSPGKGYWTKYEDRSLPIQSTAQDVKRLTLFQLSKSGLLFLAKQQLLQTGNTFEFTRALNPAVVVANAVPFLHVKRNLRPLNELVGKTDTSYANVKSMGQLQNSTYNKLKSKGAPVFGEVAGQIQFNRPGIGAALKTRLLAPLKAIRDTVSNTLSAFNPNQKRNIGELKDKWGPTSWKVSRPELETYVPQIQATIGDYQKTSIDFIAYFNGNESLRYSTKNFANRDPTTSIAKRVNNGGELADSPKDKQKRISYIKDPSNEENLFETGRRQEAYKPINTKFSDIINVSFAMGNDDPLMFRAFIKDLNQSATPEYKAYQYIGRIEKFINYTGVQREISFKLGVIAFSRDELDVVWRRINYLTGLVFPYGFNKGIMQPNITRLTIGNVYVNQPGYVTSLSTNFNELSESWELDNGKQVPIAAQMDIKFTLIEKATRIADSPFYGITDGGNGNPMSGFINNITPPKPKDAKPDSTKDAPLGDTPLDFRAARKEYLAGIPAIEPLPYQPLPDIDPETGFNLYPPF